MSSKSTENAALKFLLSVACLRTAPKHISEIAGGSNPKIGNVCYINPDELPAVGLAAREGIHKITYLPGFPSLIVATRLMPKGGVIFAPLNQAVLEEFGEDVEVYREMGFNVTREGGLIINGSPSSPRSRDIADIREPLALGDGKVIDG